MRISRRLAIAVTVVILVFAAPMGAAYALWTATSTASVNVTIIAPSAAAPVNLACTGTNSSTITLRWSSPAGPSPVGYEIYEGSAVLAASAHPAVTTSLGQAQFVVAGQHTVGVRAVYPNGATSVANPTLVITKNNGQGGRISCP